MELYILNKDFETVSIISSYKSVIWAKRYLENGDCELVIPIGEVKKQNFTTGMLVNQTGDYIDVRDYSELYVSNESIPRTGQSPAHLFVYPYIGGVEQEPISLDDQLDNGTVFDISSYDGIKFRINYSSGTFSFNYKLKSNGALDIIKPGYYIARSDDDMVCMIKDITVETDREGGDKLTVKAYDVKSVIDQRITKYEVGNFGNDWSLFKATILETLINNLYVYNIRQGDVPLLRPKNNRAVEKCASVDYDLVPTTKLSIEKESGNVGEIIRKFAATHSVGYKMSLAQNPNDDNNWWWYPVFYVGNDKTDSVIFSEDFNDLITSKYSIAYNNSANACLVKTSDSDNPAFFMYPDENGYFYDMSLEAQGMKINDGGTIRTIGKDGPKGLDRLETSVDSDVALHPDYETLRDTLFPGGTLTTNTAGTEGEYKVTDLKVECVTEDFKNWLDQHFYGSIVVEDGTEYYSCSGSVKVATMTRSATTESWKVTMEPISIFAQLWNAGKNAVAEKAPAETFEGTVIPNGQFKYKTDYDLGDVVRIENKYGISADARIIEVIESIDENGENLSLSFENKNIKMA